MRMATLGDIADWGSGGTPSRSVASYFGEGIPWLSIADLNDGLVSHAKESLTPAGVANSAAKIVPPGTLFVAMYGSIGKLGIAAREFATSQAIAFAKPKTSLVDTRYLFHFLLAQRPRLMARGRGGTQMNISQGDLKAWPIPLVPLEEQRRIVEILDAADAIYSKRRALLAHLDALAEACFHQTFAGVRATVTVESVAQRMRTGPFGSDLLHSEFVDSGISVLGLDNVVANEFRWAQRRYITPEKYQSLQRYKVEPGDVLVSIMGTTGRCVVVPDNIPVAINTKHICATTVERHKVEPEFLRASFLWHPDSRAYLRRQTKGAVMDGLNMGIIKAMPIPLPPIADQRAFADKVAKIDAQRAIAKRVLAADDELFASLQSRAFSGKL